MCIRDRNNAGLIVDTDNYTYEASDQPEGTVLAQTPAAGSKLQKDGLVALTPVSYTHLRWNIA